MRNAIFVALLAWIGSSCSNEVKQTRALVDVYGNLGDQLATLQVEVSDPDDAEIRKTETFPVASSRNPSKPDLLLQFAILPHPGREDARFLVSVTGLDAGGKFVVQARAIDRFVRETRVNVSIRLETKCANVECPDPTTTCSADILDERGRGRCVPIAAAIPGVQDASQEPDEFDDAGAEQRRDAKDASSPAPPGSDAAATQADEDAGADLNNSGTGFMVTGTTPQNGGTLASGTSAIRIVLSGAVDESTITAQSARLTRDGQPVAATPKVENGQIVLDPNQPFPLGATLRVDLTADIRSSDGVPLAPAGFEFQAPEGKWSVASIGAAQDSEVHVAVAPAGNAIVAYRGATVPGRDVWTSRYTPQQGWSSPEKISTSIERPIHSRISVAVNDSGHAVVAWDHYDYAWYNVFNGEWSTETKLSDGYAAEVVLLPNDTWYLVYQRASSPSYTINELKASVGSNSTTGGTLSKQGATVETLWDLPRLALLGSSTVAVWSEDQGNGSCIVGSRWEGAGRPPQVLSMSDTASESSDDSDSKYRVAADPGRQSAIAVWQQTAADWTNIWAARIIDGGSFGESVLISDRMSTTSRPDVALDVAGRAVAVWEQVVGGTRRIAAAHFALGQGWSPSEIISDVTPSSSAAWPVIAMEPGGNVIAAWVEADVADSTLVDVWVARYRSGQGWIAAERRVVSTARRAANQRPSIGIDQQGRAVLGFAEAEKLQIARFE